MLPDRNDPSMLPRDVDERAFAEFMRAQRRRKRRTIGLVSGLCGAIIVTIIVAAMTLLNPRKQVATEHVSENPVAGAHRASTQESGNPRIFDQGDARRPDRETAEGETAEFRRIIEPVPNLPELTYEQNRAGERRHEHLVASIFGELVHDGFSTPDGVTLNAADPSRLVELCKKYPMLKRRYGHRELKWELSPWPMNPTTMTYIDHAYTGDQMPVLEPAVLWGMCTAGAESERFTEAGAKALGYAVDDLAANLRAGGVEPNRNYAGLCVMWYGRYQFRASATVGVWDVEDREAPYTFAYVQIHFVYDDMIPLGKNKPDHWGETAPRVWSGELPVVKQLE